MTNKQLAWILIVIWALKFRSYKKSSHGSRIPFPFLKTVIPFLKTHTAQSPSLPWQPHGRTPQCGRLALAPVALCVIKALAVTFFLLFNKGVGLKSLQSLMDSLSLTLIWPWASSKACCYMNNTILACTKSWIHWTIHKLLKLHIVWIDTQFWVVHHLSTDQKIHRILMRGEFLLM
jgi:hypothetical protein